MYRHFRWGQREDQPAVSGVHGCKTENVAQEGAICRRIVAVYDDVRARDHACPPCSHDFATREGLSPDRLRCLTDSFDDLINFSIHVSDAQSSDEGSPRGEGALLPRDGDLRLLSPGCCVGGAEFRPTECGY